MRRLRDSEHANRADRFRNLVHHTALGMAVFNDNGKLLYANAAAARLAGYADDELERLSFRRLVAPEDLMGAIGEAGMRFRNGLGQATRRRLMLVRKDGSQVALAALMEATEWEGKRAIAVIIDPPPVDRVDEGGARWRNRFVRLAESLRETLVEVDEDGRILFANQAAGDLLGADALGKSLVERLPKDQRVEVRRALREARETGVPGTVETVLDGMGGQARWISRIVPVVEDGVVRCLFVFGAETTRQETTEDGQRENVSRYELLTKTAPVGIFSTDVQGNCRYVNERWCEIAGLDSERALGLGWRAGLHPEDRKQVSSAWESAVATGGVFAMEYRFQRPDGATNWVYGQAAAERGPGGTVVGYVGTITDITERKLFGEALHAAKEQAEQASIAKSQFLSVMSHEMRTPMNAVLGYAQLLESDVGSPLGSEQRDFVEHILHAGKHLLSLIDEILDLSRIESGDIPLSMEPTDPSVIVCECVGLMRSVADSRKISIDLLCTADDWAVIDVDPTRFRQVVLNLLSNAIKYNRTHGKVFISVDKPAEERLRINIADTGHGIAEAHFQAVFEPFNRTGADQLDVEGSGIGLTICKRLVEMMGGTIGLRSVLTAGSTFWIEFPLSRNSANIVAGEIFRWDTHSAGQEARKETFKLLYVEDDAANLQLMSDILTRVPHFNLITAPNAEVGLDLARFHQPSIILLDLNLPGMDGLDVIERLGAYPETRAIPVVAISTDAMSPDVENGYKAGGVNYLTKPIDVRKLLGLLNRVSGDAGFEEQAVPGG